MTSPTTLPAATVSADPPPQVFEILLEIPTGLRLTLGIGAVTVWALLGIAWSLVPDARGFGTHEQLGLTPCGVNRLLEAAGMANPRCPSCGMTTSFNRLAHLDVRGAFAANAGGAVLGIVWFAAAPWLAICAIRGKWWGFVPQEWVVVMVGVVVLAVTLVDWLIRIVL